MVERKPPPWAAAVLSEGAVVVVAVETTLPSGLVVDFRTTVEGAPVLLTMGMTVVVVVGADVESGADVEDGADVEEGMKVEPINEDWL